MMAEAAQKSSPVIKTTDPKASLFGGKPEPLFMQQYGYNPYLGPQNRPDTPGALFNEWPEQLLQAFPWSHLQLLSRDLRTQPDMTAVTCYSYG